MRGERAGGYLSVWLSLLILVLLTLFFTLLEGAIGLEGRMELESVTDQSAHSALALFCRPLHEKYDLLLMDLSDGQGSSPRERLQSVLADYQYRGLEHCAASGGDIAVTGLRFAGDEGAQALSEQIRQVILAGEGTGGSTSTLPAQEIFEEAVQVDTVNKAWQEKWDQLFEKIGSANERGAFEEGADGRGDPIPGLEAFWKDPLLKQVFSGEPQISPGELTGERFSDQPQRASCPLTGLSTGRRAEGAVLTAYVREKCGYYRAQDQNGALWCRQEYLLCGGRSDRENLEGTLKRLLGIREVSNCACLFADAGRQEQARALAGTFSMVILAPELSKPLTIALLFAWSYLESIHDLQLLVEGKRVPLIKTSADWATPVRVLLSPASVGGAGGGRRGMTYEQYLLAMVSLEDEKTVTCRLGDLMEMDVRLSEPTFSLKDCVDAFGVRSDAVAGSAGRMRMEKTFSYRTP